MTGPVALAPAALAAMGAGCPGKQPFDRQAATYCYVAVRKDLPLAQQVVQAIHAAMAATADHGGLTPHTRLALLAVDDEAHLLALASRLGREGVAFSLFDEPDHGIGASALATAPGPHARFRALRRLPLWEGPGCAGGGLA